MQLPLSGCVCFFSSRPWDPELPDDVEEMKLILHMWVALFYSKPSKVLSSRRKVVEHSNPKKFVSLNSTGDFLELSDDGEDCFGSEPCPVDSHSEPEQAPSSSLDPSTRCQGVFRPEESLADSTVSSSSGELPPGEEEPSSTSSESLSLADRAARSNLVEKCRQLELPEEEHGCDGSIVAVVRAWGVPTIPFCARGSERNGAGGLVGSFGTMQGGPQSRARGSHPTIGCPRWQPRTHTQFYHKKASSLDVLLD